MSAELLCELARVKAVFQLRTIEAVIRGPEPVTQRRAELGDRPAAGATQGDDL